jgi:peptidylprolyl isomerase|tara:strand:- start:526 stop:1098 length:573 start_codon:yes stop_codon:yes gene_type:complete
MAKLKYFYLVFFAALVFAYTQPTAESLDMNNSENTLYLELKSGRVVIEMFPDVAPGHVAHVKKLVRKGFYDGLTFHRVIGDFMAQTGDPNGDGTGGSGNQIKAEFSDLKHVRGTVSMARRADDVHSADSQFFIVYSDQRSLDGQYTIWGHVTSGMHLVDQIKKGAEGMNGMVLRNPDKIISMSVVADVTG